MIPRTTKTNVAEEAVSFARFANAFFSSVTKSTTDSIEVLISSNAKIRHITRETIIASIQLILKNIEKPATIKAHMIYKCKLLSYLIAIYNPSKEYFALFI